MLVRFSAPADAVASRAGLLARALEMAGVRGHHVTNIELLSQTSGSAGLVDVVVRLVMVGDR